MRFFFGTIPHHNSTNPAEKDVFLRLPSHEVLHGLVRVNQPEEASRLAKKMMMAGVPVRCKTLEAILRRMQRNSEYSIPRMPMELLESSKVLTLRPSMLSDRGTKFAIDLLMVARRTRQRRSKNMFRILIALCIVNGEIIAASLLFGILIRDWQARNPTGSLVPEKGGSPLPHPNTPFPTYYPLNEICKSVTRTLASDLLDVEYQLAFKASLQALANLATLLDDQAIAYPNIHPLLIALYKCPRVQERVWIYDSHGNPELVVAYDYFHDVLYRFISSLPTHPPALDEKKKMLPPLDIYDYNTLLNYALRHRNSISLAKDILYHMVLKRHQPLQPDTTTFNIIARSGTLLRSEIADFAFSKFNKNGATLAPRTSESSLTPSTLRSLLKNISNQKQVKYTLAAHIAHLTATGQPHAVVDLLPIIFPTSNLPEKQKRGELYEQDLRQSMLLGPVVFTSILNALQKAGHTGLAEMVWKRARRVEKMSWTKEVNDRLQPWCLPVIAYTIMIKLYAAEARKGHFYGKEVDRSMPISIQRPLPSIRHAQTEGWGIRMNRSTSGPRTRSEMGRYLGMKIYRSMADSAENIRSKISKLRDQGIPMHVKENELKIPEPDVRFFNAILDIVGRQPHMPPRKLKHPPGIYKRQYRKTYMDYVWKGIRTKPPDPNLWEVGRDMMAAGFEIPFLYRKFFVGVVESVDQSIPRLERDRRVFAAERPWNPKKLVGRIMIREQTTKTLDLSSRRGKLRRPGRRQILNRKLPYKMARKLTKFRYKTRRRWTFVK